MRILHVILGLGEECGGPTHGLAALARAQADLGDVVTILPCTDFGGRMVIQPGQYGLLRVMAPCVKGLLKLPNRTVRGAVRGLVRDNDIVHVHGNWRYHLIASALAARQYGIPYIIRPAGDLSHVPRQMKHLRKWLYFTLIERRYLERAVALHCCTDRELAEVKDLKLSPRHFVVAQPVESTLPDAPSRPEDFQQVCPQVGPDEEMMLYLGRITAIKRLDVLVEAFALVAGDLPQTHLVLAGPLEDVQLCGKLKALAARCGLGGRVHLPGIVRGPIKVATFRRAKLFVQPSRHENFGISTAEALAFGLACVVSDGVALSDEIAAAGAGLRFSGGPREMAEAIRKLMSDDGFRRRCQDSARSLSQRYRQDVVAKSLRQEYQRCLSR